MDIGTFVICGWCVFLLFWIGVGILLAVQYFKDKRGCKK